MLPLDPEYDDMMQDDDSDHAIAYLVESCRRMVGVADDIIEKVRGQTGPELASWCAGMLAHWRGVRAGMLMLIHLQTNQGSDDGRSLDRDLTEPE